MDPYTKAVRNMAPANNAEVVTPDDDNDLDPHAKALIVTAPGEVHIITVKGQTVDLGEWTAGQIIPIQTARVLEDTDATVVAVWDT